jgi:CheY-like chemotaxis protein
VRTNRATAPIPRQTTWRPLAHVAVRDGGLRSSITVALREQGWAVVESPSGYHLLQNIAEPLFANELWCRPQLVVVDAFSPGCSGLTIAQGLRDIGWAVPVVLIVYSSEHKTRVASDPDNWVFVTDRDVALHTVMEVARHRLRRGVNSQPPAGGPDEHIEQQREEQKLLNHLSAGGSTQERHAMA